MSLFAVGLLNSAVGLLLVVCGFTGWGDRPADTGTSLAGVLVCTSALVTILGSRDYANLGSLNWAVAGIATTMVPGLSPCFCLGLPVGGYALAVLAMPSVRGAFDRVRQ